MGRLVLSARLNFIVGGVQKAGTTALHAYLVQHPQIVSAASKELHFFDNERLDWQRPDYSLLEDAFEQPDDGRYLAFDATPIYLYWPNALERIAAYNPAIKLIFIFRDPIERAWSHWHMETNRYSETLSFSQAIRAGRDRLKNLPKGDDAYRVYSYVERGFYDQQLERVLRMFPKENVLLLESAALRTDLARTLDQIAAFLNIDAFPSLEPRDVFVGTLSRETLDLSDIGYLRSLYYNEMVRFSARSRLDISDWLTMREL